MTDNNLDFGKSTVTVGLVLALTFLGGMVSTVWVFAQKDNDTKHAVKSVRDECNKNTKDLNAAKNSINTRLVKCESDNSAVRGDIRVIRNDMKNMRENRKRDMAYIKDAMEEIKDAVE